jgi:hypothetical protein
MIKRTLIAIALMAFVASLASAALTPLEGYDPFKVYPLDLGDSRSLKVDGKATVRWPYEFKFLEVCRIPVYMEIGMYIKVIDCDKKKIVVKQVDCGDLRAKYGTHIGASDWHCYEGCVKDVEIVSNFPAVLDAEFFVLRDAEGNKKDGGKVIDQVDGAVTPNEIPASIKTKVEICVYMWKTDLENFTAGDEVRVGDVAIMAKPKV